MCVCVVYYNCSSASVHISCCVCRVLPLCVCVCVCLCVCVWENPTSKTGMIHSALICLMVALPSPLGDKHLVLSQRAYYLVCLFLIWPNPCSFVLDVWDAHYQSVLGPNYAHARSSLKLISHHYHQLVWLWQVYFETCIFISEWDRVFAIDTLIVH